MTISTRPADTKYVIISSNSNRGSLRNRYPSPSPSPPPLPSLPQLPSYMSSSIGEMSQMTTPYTQPTTKYSASIYPNRNENRYTIAHDINGLAHVIKVSRVNRRDENSNNNNDEELNKNDETTENKADDENEPKAEEKRGVRKSHDENKQKRSESTKDEEFDEFSKRATEPEDQSNQIL